MANTDESGLGRTTAVGMYPQGASPLGAIDLIGNVWEWCLNEYENPKQVEVPGVKSLALRGGSWFNDKDYARCTFRYGNLRSLRSSRIGFRLVCTLPIY